MAFRCCDLPTRGLKQSKRDKDLRHFGEIWINMSPAKVTFSRAQKRQTCAGVCARLSCFQQALSMWGHCIMLHSLTVTPCMFPCKVWLEDSLPHCGYRQPHKSLCRLYSFFFSSPSLRFSLPLSPKCNFSPATGEPHVHRDRNVAFTGSMSQMLSRSIFFPCFCLRETHREPLELYGKYHFMFHLMFPACHVIARTAEAVGCCG